MSAVDNLAPTAGARIPGWSQDSGLAGVLLFQGVQGSSSLGFSTTGKPGLRGRQIWDPERDQRVSRAPPPRSRLDSRQPVASATINSHDDDMQQAKKQMLDVIKGEI